MIRYIWIIIYLLPHLGQAQVKTLNRFQNPNARQAVAVDDQHLYVINNAAIDKVNKNDLSLMASWQDSTGHVAHLNSGIIVGDTLYCAASNYPQVPMTSSVEIFATDPLRHIGSHSFGIFKGSCTWVLKKNGYWWAFFAHYENKAQSENKGVEWSSLVKFDPAWRPIASWTLPEVLLEKLRPYSLSGGIFIHQDQLLVTGHHAPKLYLLAFPKSGSVLQLLAEYDVPIKGQGIAFDHKTGTIWGIDRLAREVIRVEIK